MPRLQPSRAAALAAALALAGAPCARGQAAAPSPSLLVLAKADRTLAVVNPVTGVVAARIPAGPDPHEVVASADGRLAYVSNYEGGAGHTITVVDLVARRVARVVDLGALRGPHGLAVADGAVWFTAEGAKAVGRYDPAAGAAGAVVQVVGTGQDRTHMVAVLPGPRVVTTNVRAGTVSVLQPRAGAPGGGPPGGGPPDGGSPGGGPPGGGPPGGGPPGGGPPGGVEWDARVIPVGPGAEGFDVSPDGREAWVANAGDGTISVVDLAAGRVARTLAAGVRGANRLKFTPDGALAFVSTLGGSDVTVLRAATGAVVARVPVGRGAAGILVQPDGARVYVACTPDDDVAVIDVRSLAVVGRLRAGRSPDGLAWASAPR